MLSKLLRKENIPERIWETSIKTFGEENCYLGKSANKEQKENCSLGSGGVWNLDLSDFQKIEIWKIIFIKDDSIIVLVIFEAFW